MRSPPSIRMLLAAVVGVGSCLAGFAATPSALQEALARGEPVTVIDIRSTARFQQGHIPGAINVPAALIREKTLPRLGRVVVCDEGLGQDQVETAVAELNRKPGIAAEGLGGGYAGWEEAKGATTQTPGVRPEELRWIAYDQLKKGNFAEIVLVDLRQPRPEARQGLSSGSAAAAAPLTDLHQEFPQASITRSPFNLPPTRQADSGTAGQSRVLVLIDSDGKAAPEMARQLKANGLRRVVILAGGEEILARGGRRGLERTSVTVDVPEPKR